MALFVATLATIIVAGLFWRQFVLLRTIENQQLTTQSRLLLDGALDWARAMLREDALRSNFDGLTEFWAQGLEPTRLDQLGESSTLASQATIAGDIEDAQSRMNLRNLLKTDGTIDERNQDALKRLCELLGLPDVTAELIARHVQQAWARDAATGTLEGVRPLPPWLPSDLAGIDGLHPDAATKLAPYIVILDAVTPVNVNTATAEVIAAQIGGVTLAQARALVGERDRVGYFVNLGDVRNRLRDESTEINEKIIQTRTQYFFVRGQVRLARANIRMEALVRRPPPGGQGPVEVLWQREL